MRVVFLKFLKSAQEGFLYFFPTSQLSTCPEPHVSVKLVVRQHQKMCQTSLEVENGIKINKEYKTVLKFKTKVRNVF